MADGILREIVIWVEGEICDYRGYPNYAFFSLADEDATLPCVIFKEAMDALEFDPQEGTCVLVRGRLGIYTRKGQFRLQVFEAEEAGEGRLRREFLRLMRSLSREGLFDAGLKRPLPPYPDQVGLITSLEGAAVRDVVTNLTRRFPGSRLVIRGVRVQGEDAVGDILAALELFNRAYPVDVLILARGGGSLEDLHPFNTEEVVRAIRASDIPVVTGVGHEPDVTLADLAADFRASTPTGAAEAVVPSSLEVIALLGEVQASLLARTRHILHRHERRLAAVEKRKPFSDPTLMVSQPLQRIAEEETGLITAARSSLLRWDGKVEAASRALSRYPREYRDLPRGLEAAAAKLSSSVATWMRWRSMDPLPRERELRLAASALLARGEGRVKLTASRLEALSPLAVLARGYSIVTLAGEEKPLTDSAEAGAGDVVDVRLHRGRLRCEVKSSEEQA